MGGMLKKRENWIFLFAAIGAIAGLVKILEYFGISPRTLPATANGVSSLPVVPSHSYMGVIWGGLLFVFSFLLSAYGFYFANKRKEPSIEIVSVWNNDQVEFKQVIYGVATPGMPVELRVFSGGFWHGQWRAEIEANKWHALCQFGNSERPVESRYRLVAISPKTPLPSKISELPADAVQSAIISVVRSVPPIANPFRRSETAT